MFIPGKPTKDFVNIGQIASDMSGEDEMLFESMEHWAKKSSKSISQIVQKIQMYKPASSEVFLPALRKIEAFIHGNESLKYFKAHMDR